MKQSEHCLQVGVARLLELCLDPDRTWWSGLDHAAKLSPRYGADRKRRGVKAGLPDFIVMWSSPHDADVIGIEMKSEKGRLTPEQKEVGAAWLMMGHVIYLARSMKDVQVILEDCEVPMRRKLKIFGG